MAKYMQISGLNCYPYRKYSTRTIKQIDPYLYLGHYVSFSYDFNYFQEMIKILEEGGSFEQIEKHNEKPTVYTFNKKTLELTINSPINRRLCLTYKLNKEVIEEIIQLIKEDVANTMSDDAVREAVKVANAKQRLAKFRDKSKTVINEPETVPEQPKEEKQEETKQEDEKLTADQKNDNDESIDKQPIIEEEKPRVIYGSLDEAIDTILSVEKVSKEDIKKPEYAGKRLDIAFALYPSQRKYFENRYKITGPSDMFEELKKFFEQ